ncbi:MAG: hypothetical protein WKF43_00370 [Acidimicrobiales bacterium]
MSMLNSHPQIVCDSELLAEEVLFPSRFVDGRAVRARREGARAYGFKLQLNQLQEVQRLGDPAAYLAGLHHRGHKIIRLRRRNLLKQVLSFARAKQSVTHVYRGESHPRPGGLEVDPGDVLAGLTYIESLEQLAERLLVDLPHTSLVYEDDLADRASQRRTLDRIFAELGVRRIEVEPLFVPTSPTRLIEAVVNYDALATAVGRTRFASFLE